MSRSKPGEDSERLKEDVEVLKKGLRGRIEILRQQGEPAFHTADTYLAEKAKQQEAAQPVTKRWGRPKKQSGQEDTAAVSSKQDNG